MVHSDLEDKYLSKKKRTSYAKLGIAHLLGAESKQILSCNKFL